MFQQKVAFHVQSKDGGKMWKLLGGASDFAFYSGVQQWVLGKVGRRVLIFSQCDTTGTLQEGWWWLGGMGLGVGGG